MKLHGTNRAARIGLFAALSLLFLGACQDPNSALLDHSAIVVDFSATQNEGVEKGLIASGEAVLTNGVSQSTAPFVRSASGEWQVSSIASISFPATLTIRLYSGADQTGWLLFQGTRVLSALGNAPERIPVANVTYRKERFAGVVGTVDRQSLNYTFHKVAEYNTDGDPVTPIPNPTFSLILDASGGFLASPNPSDPPLVRQ